MAIALRKSHVGYSMPTYNARYPGFDENDYAKLDGLATSRGLTGQRKTNFMDQAYQQYYPQVLNNHMLNKRQEQINQGVADNGTALLNGDKNTLWKMRLTDLSQQAKMARGISYDVDDMEVINAMKEGIPDGEQLLLNYLNNGDKEIFYKAGIDDNPREKLKENFWSNLWDNMRTMAAEPVDNWKKFGVRTMNEATSALFPKIVKKVLGDTLPAEMGINFDDYVESFSEGVLDPRLKNLSLEYQDQVNQNATERRARNLDQDIKNYYDSKGYTKLLKEGDFKGFIYKSMGDAAQNWDMPIIIGASIFQPEVGLALMATDTYARENQEAFENMMNSGADYEQAQEGAVVVGLINAGVEVTLDRLLGGVETTASNEIRRTFMKNVQDEAVKKGLGRFLMEAGTTQLKSSAEEGLEEVVQQIVQNAAVKTVDENQKLFEGIPQAFEGGFYNPMNLLAGGGNLTSNINANKSEIRQSIMDGAYSLGETLGSATAWGENQLNKISNIGSENSNELLTRTIPEKVVENQLSLTPTERAKVEKTGISPANFILKEGLANLNNNDKIVALADVGADGYNKITETFKNVIPQTEQIESADAQKMLKIMTKVIESSDILTEEYADYLNTVKKLSEQTSFDPYVALAIKRDFDALVGHDIYNNKGQVMKGEEKKAIAKWRSNLSEELNKLGDKYGVDVREENNRIMNSITIRDGLLRSLSQNKKNNYLGLQDLGFGALLSSGNPAKAFALIAAKKYGEKKIGKLAQNLYNSNKSELEKVNKQKGPAFISNGDKDANNLSLGNIVSMTTTTDNSQGGLDTNSELEVSEQENSKTPIYKSEKVDIIEPSLDTNLSQMETQTNENINQLYERSNNGADGNLDKSKEADTPTGMSYLDYRHELSGPELVKFQEALDKLNGEFNDWNVKTISGLLRRLQKELGGKKAAMGFLKSLGYEGIEYRSLKDRYAYNNGEQYVDFEEIGNLTKPQKENKSKKTTLKEAKEQAEKIWKEQGWKWDGKEWTRYAQHWVGEYDVKNGYYANNPKGGHREAQLEKATDIQHEERVNEHAKMIIDFDKADSKKSKNG